MRALSLLFDPRGAIDRRTFLSGVLQLIVLGVVVGMGLGRLGVYEGAGAFPVFGDAMVVVDLAGHAHSRAALGVISTAALMLVAARYYAAVCLMLKRSRDAGLDHRPVIAFGLVNLAIHGLMTLWTWSVADEGMAVILPMFADMAAGAVVWTIFLGWTGSRPGRLQVKPAS